MARFAVTLMFSAALAAPTVRLPRPDENGTYLFWSPEEQLVGYSDLVRPRDD